jgi:hypothetical protein
MNKKIVSLISFLSLIILILGFVAYNNFVVAQYLTTQVNQLDTVELTQDQIDDLQFELNSQKSQNRVLNSNLEEKRNEVIKLTSDLNDLEEDLGLTKTKLAITTSKYEEAKPYQERIERGQSLNEYYTLLDDRNDYAKPIILNYLGLSNPTPPSNDEELWQRGKLIYNWLSNNYEYCGDKGLRVGNTFYEFQFYSPDELLMSDNSRCGDCDDFATLFAGLMYASGVPENKVWVVCGTVESGGHCWNWLDLGDQTYRIDGVCSQEQELFGFLGFSWGNQGAYYTNNQNNVDCFKSYNPTIKMNPNNYFALN